MKLLLSRRTGLILAVVYLMVVFGLDYLSVERGVDGATVAVTVITFPAGTLTTIVFLLLAVVFGFDDYSPGPDSYAPSVYAISGIVQLVLVWCLLKTIRRHREKTPHL
ncbi:hypothetical protein [Streptomyces sp. NBC_01481]|uniref:hypothetical protein n=1 Tax=Streptomyces sp. NBC_01481 TaxID=2975869 RepID=UPI002259C541|nr:hypothetical protein [Streptomyces sp. NBC_01481]MCX4586361.1 hypothetical protein [Streptomyces sp. NBC_01481]